MSMVLLLIIGFISNRLSPETLVLIWFANDCELNVAFESPTTTVWSRSLETKVERSLPILSVLKRAEMKTFTVSMAGVGATKYWQAEVSDFGPTGFGFKELLLIPFWVVESCVNPGSLGAQLFSETSSQW
jgi:hypothetical protein